MQPLKIPHTRRFHSVVLPVAGSPCEHDGICVNTPGSFACNCTQGFTGPRCETNVNECESHPCQNDGSCLDDPGTFRCVCMPGKCGQRHSIYILYLSWDDYASSFRRRRVQLLSCFFSHVAAQRDAHTHLLPACMPKGSTGRTTYIYPVISSRDRE